MQVYLHGLVAMFTSLLVKWGSDPEGFFFNTYLQTTKATGFDLQFVGHLFWPIVGIWALTLIILYGGVKKVWNYRIRFSCLYYSFSSLF